VKQFTCADVIWYNSERDNRWSGREHWRGYNRLFFQHYLANTTEQDPALQASISTIVEMWNSLQFMPTEVSFPPQKVFYHPSLSPVNALHSYLLGDWTEHFGIYRYRNQQMHQNDHLL
jgi:hypothetical protein